MSGSDADLIVVGAGAAGLMAAIWAGRAGRLQRIVLLDSAAKPGAKILVSGGGRCNVTHQRVDETEFAGAPRHLTRKVLKRFTVEQTIEFFGRLGVTLKREETGKLFPTTDNARTVLAALLSGAQAASVTLRHPYRVEAITRYGGDFLVTGSDRAAPTAECARPRGHAELRAPFVILATGGRSLPKSGSDGHGYEMAHRLGHTITPRVWPALVPLTLSSDSFIRALSGITVPATLEVRSGTGRRLASMTGSMLLTHFGLSGPAVLDISRHFIDARATDPNASLFINWLPGETAESVDGILRGAGAAGMGTLLSRRLPGRLALTVCSEAKVEPMSSGHNLTREARRALVSTLTAMRLPVTGDRGFTYAEVTAGGVPLEQLHLDTMQSKVCPGLSLCGEICDVDGRIGGFNFQWAWASGYVAGVSAGI